MERSEPSLVPEWLKTSGSNTANGTTAHLHLTSSSLHSDDVPKLARNKSTRNYNDHELGRPSSSDRNSSTYFRRGANGNGSPHLRSYSSFGRNTRRDWDRDRDRDRDGYERHDGVRDHKQRDFLEPPFPGNHERDGLKRSQSMITAKRGEAWPKRSMADASSATKSKSNEGNGSLDKGNSVGSMPKVAFEREFPSLVSDEKPSAAEIGRIPSPVLSASIHGLPLGSSPVIGTDKWTSALAEAPAVAGGSNSSTGPQVLPSSSSPVASVSSSGLNMAEAVAQGPPPRLQTAPKTSKEIRLEELAIRQSRQLIPVTPSMPKPLVSNSSDKGKGKAAPQVPTPLHGPFRGVPVKTDASKPSNGGKLLVLKPAREKNGGVSAAKDNLSPTVGSKETTAALAVATPVAGSATSKGSANNIVSPKAERKHVHPVLEKRPTAQSQSRNDFFNLVRKKSLPNSPAVPEAVPAVVSSPADEPGEVEVTKVPATCEEKDASLADVSNACQPMENKINLSSNKDVLPNDGSCLQNGKSHATSFPLFSEEEEAAFLHKLGWQENADEGALTEEEISAFFNKWSKCVDSKPSVKILQGAETKFPMLLSSQVHAVSNGLSSSDTNAES